MIVTASQLFCENKRLISYILKSSISESSNKRFCKFMQAQDFLQNYEIKTWRYSSGSLRFLILATLLKFILIFALGQTNLLQAKACDGYFVGRMCQILDTLYVGSEIFAGNNGYVIREYKKTTIGSAEQTILIDETGQEPVFVYPQGYFKPKEFKKDKIKKKRDHRAPNKGHDAKSASNQNIPITSPPDKSSGRDLLVSDQKLPKYNKNVVKGELPKDPIGKVGNKNAVKGELPKGPIGSIKNKEEKNGKLEKDKTLDKPFDMNVDKLSGINEADIEGKKLEAVNSIKKQQKPPEDFTDKAIKKIKNANVINRKPLDDFADEVLEKWQTDKVDLSKEFKIRMVGALTKNGKLDQKLSEFQEMSGDKAVVEVAKRAIESVGDSGWLNYLSRFDVKEVNLTFKQNDSKLSAIVDSVFPNLEKAKTVANGLHALMQTVLLLEKNGVKKLGEDEKTLLKSAKVVSEGNILKINFELPKEIAKKMIDDRLREYQAKKLKEQKDKDQKQAKPNESVGKVDDRTSPDT